MKTQREKFEVQFAIDELYNYFINKIQATEKQKELVQAFQLLNRFNFNE